MSITTNIPVKKIIITDSEKICIGDYVRVLCYPEDRKYLYGGRTYIGYVREIENSYFVIDTYFLKKEITLDNVFIIKTVDVSENFEDKPYINDDEMEFWRTHWYTNRGIEEKPKEYIYCN